MACCGNRKGCWLVGSSICCTHCQYVCTRSVMCSSCYVAVMQSDLFLLGPCSRISLAFVCSCVHVVNTVASSFFCVFGSVRISVDSCVCSFRSLAFKKRFTVWEPGNPWAFVCHSSSSLRIAFSSQPFIHDLPDVPLYDTSLFHSQQTVATSRILQMVVIRHPD